MIPADDFGQFKKAAMLALAGCAIGNHHPGLVSFRQRVLRDQFFGEIEMPIA
ncbi:MAG: hypothetical protein MZV64_34420 [Ignavibacteriales bacterium]|nr:hypothetical protein [Ignavibacteriales bacterium]